MFTPEGAESPARDEIQAVGKEPFDVFRYLVFERSDLYRSVIDVFTEAKAEFRLHLRPTEIATRLLERGFRFSEDELASALDQLVDWGNLQSYHDTAEVATIADFQRRRLLYQLTAAGEAAERAALEFLQLLNRPVALEAQALGRIRDLLAELAQLARSSLSDGAKISAVLRTIAADTEQLTAQAQSFFRWLHEQTSQQGADLASFLRHKERLIDYLQRFLAELAAQTGVITARILELEPSSEALLRVVAEHEADAAFAKDETDRRALLDAAMFRWQQRWRGLRRWFVGVEGDAHVKQLRNAASAAIPSLLAIAAELHSQRTTRSDRRADMLELAAWFLEAGDDRQAHRLWSAAFATGSVRHLRVDAATLDQRDQQRGYSNQSWLDAPPIPIAPQLRQTGRAPAPAPARKIVDRDAERRELRRRQVNEQHQLAFARGSLIDLGPRRLTEVGHLHHEALLLLVELLDRVAGQRSLGTQGTAVSEDGSLRITVDWDAAPDAAMIETPLGCLHTKDARIHVIATDES
jgi:uncharacterized protein (TIGR02677 family)